MFICPVCNTVPNPSACSCGSLWFQTLSGWSRPRGWNFGSLAVSEMTGELMRKVWVTRRQNNFYGHWVVIPLEEADAALAREIGVLTVECVMGS